MTKRLYYTDAYLAEFKARVTWRSEEALRVTLEETAFYPTSGGQQFDTGTLNDVDVIDVIDEDENIIHVLAKPLRDDHVTARVNWERRFDHMQQHTGQHVLSAVFEDLFGFRTASVHFGIDSSSVDLETKEVTRDQILAAEARANEIVFENKVVTVSFEEGAVAQGLRKPPPREGTLRVITVDGVDRSACGGTHVRATGEIGPILLRKQDRMHGNARIEFICGARAVRSARQDFESLAGVAAILGVGAHETADRVAIIAADLREAERARKKLGEELATFRAHELYERAAPDSANVRWIIEEIGAASLDDFRPLAHAMASLTRAAFVGVIAEPSQIIFSTSEDSGIDAGKTLRAALTAVGGRGGGSSRVAQGSASADHMKTVVAHLRASSK